MKLIFPIELNNGLEHTLAAARYSRFWEENEERVMAAFYDNAGLRFKQRKITVRIIDGPVSRAGNSERPMELSVQNNTPDEVTYTLVHELAHRLVIGNGIVPSSKTSHARSRASYHLHRHIFLFLYDAMVELIGKEQTEYCIAEERALPNPLYEKAWSWALSMTYDERQAAFRRLKKRYNLGGGPS